jgi:hypothetical protein
MARWHNMTKKSWKSWYYIRNKKLKKIKLGEIVLWKGKKAIVTSSENWSGTIDIAIPLGHGISKEEIGISTTNADLKRRI